MSKAQLLTIGTEITSGEVVNSNASWVSLRLEDMGVRVFSHLSVRDQREEILKALKYSTDSDVVIVTGGLGPTSDDITREVMAEHTGLPLEFDHGVWAEMQRFYHGRGLPLREAHRHQCHFPAGARRLRNPVGTALGFQLESAGRLYFVMPGPPRELEGMWNLEVEGPLRARFSAQNWMWERWTCLGAPESEVAELVEPCLADANLEFGYRAAVPYVKVKVYVDRGNREHQRRVEAVSAALAPYTVARQFEDLAEELLKLWPSPILHLHDSVCETFLLQRLFAARRALENRGERAPQLDLRTAPEAGPEVASGIVVSAMGEECTVVLNVDSRSRREIFTLPYKVPLLSERGRRSAAEWAIWSCLKTLR
jgi:molybdenum cofactor synthesis domain-containing protein